MATVASYPHIVKPEGKPARLVENPRVRVAQIVSDYLFRHWTPEQMVEQYPHLHLAEVYAAMTYYFDHQEEIEAEIQATDKLVAEKRAEMERNPPPVLEKLRAIKRQQSET